MKTSLVLLLLPAVALAAVSPTASAPTIAVIDFGSDSGAVHALGSRDIGHGIAHILSSDLSALSPLTVVSPANPQQRPEDAATTVVSGTVAVEGTDTVMTARVTSAGKTAETSVRTEKSTSVADAVSLLAMQVGKIALTQQGAEPVSWGTAQIVGTAKPATFLKFQEVTSVMAIDGIAIADETQTWDRKRPLLPGLHNVFVRYYDGTSTAGHSFTIDAKPGETYVVHSDRPVGQGPNLWISEASTDKAVTDVVEASVGDPARVIQGAIDSDPRGMWSELNNPAFVRRVAVAGK